MESFVSATLEEYSRKVGIPSPSCELLDPKREPDKVIEHLGLAFGSYDPREKRIYLNKHLFNFLWKKNVEKAKRIIQRILAEEYWHHVQKMKGKIVFDLDRLYRVRPFIETEAKKRAEELSGISEVEYRRLIRQLLGLRWLKMLTKVEEV